MDFMIINSLRNYTQNLKLENKWKKRKAENNFKPDPSMNEIERKNAQFKHSYKIQQENMENDETLSSIMNKVNSGAELSDAEMGYLKIKSPQVYQSIKRLEMEEKAYERELEKCETKEDVEKLKYSKINGALSKINSVKNNPNIPDGKKLEIVLEVQKSMDMVEKCHVKFAESGKLAKLPSDAEKAKAEEVIKEAERQEIENNLKPENTEEVKMTKNDTTENTSETVKTEVEHSFTDNDREMTKFEAEHTPEAEKLKRSKAKSAYLRTMNDIPDETSEN